MADARHHAQSVGAPQFRCRDYVFELAGDRELVARLEALFVDLVTHPVADPHIWSIETSEAHARVTVDRHGVGRWVARDLFAATVISKLTLAVIGDHPTSLHLHAGAVVDDERTILLVAPSGSGKSTLTCALVAAGARYRTDEVVGISPDGLSVATFPKPISVKRFGIEVVERLTGLTRGAGSGGWEIPASSFGSVASDGEYPVTTIMFNLHVPSQSALVEPLHRATAVRRVLSDSQDAELVGPDSLLVAAHLTRSAHCLQVTGGDAAEVADAILAAHRLPVEPGKVTMVPSPATGAGPARGHGVASLVVDGRAVLYTPEPHHLVELDEAQTLWWMLLDGTPFDQTVHEVVRETGASRDEVLAAGHAVLETFRLLGVLDDP